MKIQLSKEFMLAFRQALLMIVDAIEKEIEMLPTTADIRKMHKSEM